MIKINLTAAKKEMDISNLGGFDFSQLKIKAVGLAILILYLPDFFLTPMWEEELNKKTEQIQTLQQKANSLKSKVSRSATLEKQIRELRAQEENLGRKLKAVKEAIALKKNPSGLLLFIAKNIPDDLWIRDLSIEKETMVIKGEALNYMSVGTFVTNLRSSIFIRDASIKNTTSSIRPSDKRRVEVFEVQFEIARFE